MMDTRLDAVPPRSAYSWYLAGSSLWIAGMSLQGFMFTWMLVGILERPASDVGFARSLAEFPPLVVLFIGGLLGDRYNGRTYLAVMHVLMALPPLALAAVHRLDLLDYWWVVAFGIAMSSIQALSDPARQSVLSRVTRLDTQRAVTVMIICTSLVGLSGFYLGGRLDVLGLSTLLVLQAVLFFTGLAAVTRMPSLPGHHAAGIPRPRFSGGLRAVWSRPLIRDLVGLNFLSSLFNAGAYVIVIPYIVKEIYFGDAAFFATVMIVFSAGSIGSNVALLAFMPLLRPGRLFLLMQLTRVAILLILVLQPALWLFHAAMFAWGLNMGITTTMVRTTVQEAADPAHRSQILSILLLSFMVSAPVSAVLLGVLVELTSPLAGLLPGIVISLVIFALGTVASPLWSYRSAPDGVARYR
jgi:predicted MFS family arabinose efflux permease